MGGWAARSGALERQTQGVCELPAHGFAGHPSAGSPLCGATMGRPGCPGPLGAASAPGWPALLPQIIPSLGNVQGQEPMAPLAASRHRGSLPAGPSSGCCPSLESHQAYLSSGHTPSSLAPLLSPTALVPPPDTQPVGTTCYLVVGFASSPAHHRIRSSICLHRLCLHHTASGTPHTRCSLTTTLALHLQRRTWLRPGLPYVLRDTPLFPASLFLHLPVDFIGLSLQVPVSLFSGSLAHIFSFHSNPTSRAPLAQVSALLTWARVVASEGTLTPSCPHP